MLKKGVRTMSPRIDVLIWACPSLVSPDYVDSQGIFGCRDSLARSLLSEENLGICKFNMWSYFLNLQNWENSEFFDARSKGRILKFHRGQHFETWKSANSIDTNSMNSSKETCPIYYPTHNPLYCCRFVDFSSPKCR